MLRAGQGPSVKAFEPENRAYFAQTISDRGDALYDRLAEQLESMPAERGAGTSAS